MYILKKAIQYLSPLLVLATFIYWALNKETTYYIAAVLFVIQTVTIIILTRQIKRGTFFNFYFTTFFLLFSSFVFFLIIDHIIVLYIFAFAIAIVYNLVLSNILSYIFESADYQPYALENIYSYVNLISLFLLYAGFYGFLILLGWPVWVFVILCFFLTAMLFMRTLWSYKIEWNRSKLYILIVATVMTEAFYIISILPTSYIFNGLIMIIIYYLLINFIKDHLKDRFNKKNVRFYLIVAGVVFVVSILTARWS
ncbi:MAG: hypothetical protein Q8P20_02590 [bacterium]|nr:hypothetical protein [bacterium]